MLRNGVLVAEDSPTNLLHQFDTDSLEFAFITLCKKQDRDKQNMNSTRSREVSDERAEMKSDEKILHDLKQVSGKSVLMKCLKVQALITKNFLQIIRRPS